MRIVDYEWLYALEDNFWWFVGMRRISAALLDPVCAPSVRGRSILDAGCGTGANLIWLERYALGGRVTGVDFASEALNFCRARTNEYLVRASVSELPFADEVFDLATSFDVLGQLQGAEADDWALGEMYRVLRPGGIAFIRVAAYEWMRSGHDLVLGTQRRYHLPALVGKIRQAGFNPLRATYANTLLLPAVLFRRLILPRIGLADGDSDVKPLPRPLRWLNRVLTDALYIEARWLAKPKASLRAGLSCICVAEKPRSLRASDPV
jgi:SAM-dependent methyltransferase